MITMYDASPGLVFIKIILMILPVLMLRKKYGFFISI